MNISSPSRSLREIHASASVAIQSREFLEAKQIVNFAAAVFRDVRAGMVSLSPVPFPMSFTTTGRDDQYHVASYLERDHLKQPIREFACRYLEPMMTALAGAIPADAAIIDDVLELPHGVQMAALDNTGVLRLVIGESPIGPDYVPPDAVETKEWYNPVIDDFEIAPLALVMRFDMRVVVIG